MDVYLACPNCDREIRFSHDEDELPSECPHCSESLDLESNNFSEGEKLKRCVLCGEDDFYKSTQINPTFGISLVVLGTVLFLGAVYFVPGMRGFLWGMVVLLSLAVFDRVMRIVLPESVICYRCSTVYSNVSPEQEFEDYDHEHAAAIKYE